MRCEREFERIKAAVKDEFDWLYGTEHYEPAIGAYSTDEAGSRCPAEEPAGRGVIRRTARQHRTNMGTADASRGRIPARLSGHRTSARRGLGRH